MGGDISMPTLELKITGFDAHSHLQIRVGCLGPAHRTFQDGHADADHPHGPAADADGAGACTELERLENLAFFE